MRYYKIEIDGGKTVFTSFLNGQNLRGALQIELDVPQAPMHSPDSAGAFVKIWGIPLAQISQASNLNNKAVKVYGGFQKGLPLANPRQAGLLVQGFIFQAFGNWQGTDMTLDLMIVAGTPPGADAPPDTAKNISFNWKKGQTVDAAVKSALTTAYPGYTITTNLNANLVAPEDQPGVYTGVKAFAEYLFGASRSLISQPNYPGAQILFDGATINVFDQPAANATPKQIAFTDLIGQPTWILAPSIAFKTMMRADIQPGDMVKMPATLITNTQQAQSSLINQKAAQQGTFLVTSVHHYGNFRQPDAYSWVTEFNAVPTTVQGTTP